MKKLFYVCILGYFFVTCNSKSDKATSDSTLVKKDSISTNSGAEINDFKCIPGKRAGFITSNTTLQELIQKLGEQSVSQHDTLFGVEGDFVMGTIIYKGTANEAHIYWKDTINFKNPALVQIGGNEKANATDTKWYIENSVKIGTTLKEIEKFNGKPFKFSGFGWDYGGQIVDLNKGKLQETDSLSYLSMDLAYNYGDEKENKVAEKLLGDSVFMSSNPNAQKLNPKVVQFGISFE